MDREEALEIIRKNMPSDKSLPVYEALQALIPELKESEDERIRKAIIHYILYKAHGVSEEQEHSWIAYLEKQKDIDKMIVVSPEVWDNAISDAFKNGKKEGEKQKEQKPIKTEVYEVGKGTTVCGQDYKCKKDYMTGTCRYIKDAIYHCSRDGYLNDQNGVSWSCSPEWFNEYIQSNTEWAEEEKTRFISGQFLQCKLSFDEFKEGEHYWLEYVGDDMYIGRSDNILNQKFHITPRQLYTLFSQQLDEAAEEWCKRNNKGIALCDDKKSHYLTEGVDAFKAGVEWMAEQGLVSEGIIINQMPGEDTMIELNEYIDNLEDCDEVIVNIRKKQ